MLHLLCRPQPTRLLRRAADFSWRSSLLYSTFISVTFSLEICQEAEPQDHARADHALLPRGHHVIACFCSGTSPSTFTEYKTCKFVWYWSDFLLHHLKSAKRPNYRIKLGQIMHCYNIATTYIIACFCCSPSFGMYAEFKTCKFVWCWSMLG